MADGPRDEVLKALSQRGPDQAMTRTPAGPAGDVGGVARTTSSTMVNLRGAA